MSIDIFEGSTDTSVIYMITVQVCPLIHVVYLWRREDNPMCGEEGFYDPTSETEWP